MSTVERGRPFPERLLQGLKVYIGVRHLHLVLQGKVIWFKLKPLANYSNSDDDDEDNELI